MADEVLDLVKWNYFCNYVIWRAFGTITLLWHTVWIYFMKMATVFYSFVAYLYCFVFPLWFVFCLIIIPWWSFCFKRPECLEVFTSSNFNLRLDDEIFSCSTIFFSLPWNVIIKPKGNHITKLVIAWIRNVSFLYPRIFTFLHNEICISLEVSHTHFQ